MTAFITSCARNNNFDRQTGASREEIKDIFFGDPAARAKKIKTTNKSAEKSTEPSIPQFNSIPRSSRMITIPAFPKNKPEKLISFSVTDQIPLKDVLIELAKAANIDVDLDPNISGGVIVNANNRPLTEVLNRICEMGDLRYSLKNDRLLVEQDLPYPKIYALDFLIDGDLWGSVETNILALIGDTGGSASSNKLSNVMTIFASQKNHIEVDKYIKKVKESSSAQVLIEAKVVEVALDDNYKTGINWSIVEGNGNNILSQTAGFDSLSPITLVLNSLDVSISALEEFGTVKGVSSPRINALNNQKATLNFTEKLVYFTNDATNSATTTTGSSSVNTTVTSTMHEEPTGTELAITPVIDLRTNEITLDVKPKITISNRNAIQTVTVIDNNVSRNLINEIPIINTRELHTIAKIQSGNVLVIGGLMSEKTENRDKGIPYLSDIPYLGNLFKSVSKVSSVTETVIFIKATVINSGGGIGNYDRTLHDTFTSSTRPFLNN